MRTSLQHWLALWQRIGAECHYEQWHAVLVSAYCEPTRHYHNLQHLEECLLALDDARASEVILNADVIELALWFHDAVYEARASDNEERSAALAEEALRAEPCAGLLADVHRLILATKTHQAEGHDDARWLIDIDLAILGQPKPRFKEYERQIREEYSWVALEIYCAKRAEVLASFLNRPAIYSTHYFRDGLEESARRNIGELIAALLE